GGRGPGPPGAHPPGGPRAAPRRRCRRPARAADRGGRGAGVARGRHLRLRRGVREVTDPYPLGLRLSGLRVLVVGGGTVASRRVPALLAAGARVVLVSPTLTPALRAHADADRLHWEPRRFEPSDVDGAWLVHVAVDDPPAAAAVSAAA